MKPIRIVFVAVALLIAPTSSQTGNCDLPSEADVQTVGTQILDEAQTEGNAEPRVTLLNMTFTCLARVSFDKYKTANVIAYTSTIYSRKAAKVELNQFTLECSPENTWRAHIVGSHDKTIPDMPFDIKTEYRCAECAVVSLYPSVIYNSTINCLYCHSTCLEKGQGSCSGILSTHCCPYFNSDTGLCVDDCRTIHPNFGPNATYHCVCQVSCPPGYAKDLTECSCNLVDGCEAARQPCGLGGSCTSILSASPYYSCQCDAGHTGQNCSIPVLDCDPGCMDDQCDTTTGCCTSCEDGLVLGNNCNCVQAPTTEAPTTEAPTTEAPTTEAPTTEAPTTEAPTTEAPTTEAPTTEAPTTEALTTEALTTEAPTTEAPTTKASTTPTEPTGVCPSTCQECEVDNPTCCSVCANGSVVASCQCVEEASQRAASSQVAGITIGLLLFILLIISGAIMLAFVLYYTWNNKTKMKRGQRPLARSDLQSNNPLYLSPKEVEA